MKSTTSRIKMVLLVTLTALLVFMMPVPAGFAKVGVKEGDWVKYSAFTGLDHTVVVTEYLYANYISNARNEWGKKGVPPYLDTIDYDKNYINATADSQEIGDFEFQKSVDGTIGEVYIELNCRQVGNGTIKVWYSIDGGSTWIDSGTLTLKSYWDWRYTGDQFANIDTWDKVNSLRVYLESVANGTWGGLVEVDCMRLRIEKPVALYAPPNLWNLTWGMPDYWPENSTEWMDMTVQSVSGSNVTVNSITHFENGTEYTKTLSGDVETASGTVGFFLIPADLVEHFEVPWDDGVTGPTCALVPLRIFINGTVSRGYAGAFREVNYVKLNYTCQPAPTRVILEAYWDKATGVLCEISISVSHGPYKLTRGFIDAWTSFKMTETNIWLSQSELESELKGLKDDYETLQGQLNTTKSDLEEAIADLEASIDDLEKTISMWQMLTVVLLIIGLAVGFIIAWVVKKPKR